MTLKGKLLLNQNLDYRPSPQAFIYALESYWRFQLSHGLNTLGRSELNDACISWDGSISRFHAEIRYVEAEQVYEIVDKQSSNGTWVNGKEIDHFCRLKNGDRILIGATELLFSVKAGISEAVFNSIRSLRWIS